MHSNLCTEITRNTKSGKHSGGAPEVAVCNLGSVNLAAHVGPDGTDVERLRRTVRTAVRMLDIVIVIDVNTYTISAARRSNLAHRPIGVGLIGFATPRSAAPLPPPCMPPGNRACHTARTAAPLDA